MRRRLFLRTFRAPLAAITAVSSLAVLPACGTGTSVAAADVATTIAATVATAIATSTSAAASLVPAVAPDRPLAGPAATVPVTASSSLPANDAVAGLLRIQASLDQCLLAPTRCNVDGIAAPGSPAHRVLADLVGYYVTNGLVVRVVPELSYVVVEHVQTIGPDRVEITLCEADGSWQMDSRGTARTDDDIVWDDSIVSRRARHTLVRTGGVWRRFEIVELQLWLGEQRCPARIDA